MEPKFRFKDWYNNYGLSAKAYRLILELDFMRCKDNDLAWPSIEYLCAELRYSRATVFRALKELKDKNCIFETDEQGCWLVPDPVHIEKSQNCDSWSLNTETARVSELRLQSLNTETPYIKKKTRKKTNMAQRQTHSRQGAARKTAAPSPKAPSPGNPAVLNLAEHFSSYTQRPAADYLIAGQTKRWAALLESYGYETLKGYIDAMFNPEVRPKWDKGEFKPGPSSVEFYIAYLLKPEPEMTEVQKLLIAKQREIEAARG